MENGLYEKIIDTELLNQIKEKEFNKKRKVDESEEARVLALAYQNHIYEKLLQKNKKERLSFVEYLNKIFETEEIKIDEGSYQELISMHEDYDSFNELNKHRPQTSIATSSLLTGYTGPTLESELRREIRTADEIYFLVSFIKYSGLRLILDDLREFTKSKKLKIITTSYMGASDYKAIYELSKLPNTEIKISYDTKRTRLHAKAYYFKRKTGFSTAYIGSSNLSNPAMSNGLEWNLKVSEYTSPDVINSIIQNFKTYWNDEEFTDFSLHVEEDKRILKESLAAYRNDQQDHFAFFDLKPYEHQKIILEDLQFEREEHKSYRNLVVSATGTGKTMVAAFDYKNQIKNGDKKILFLAHRKEILKQALYTFRSVLKDYNFGELWTGETNIQKKTHLFATIQTLNSSENYKDFAKDYFDYIVIDESHHSAAHTYLNVLEYFHPEILLGLTATPERMDNLNILEFFDNRIASEIRLTDAINRKLLSPFHYFGITDPEDLSHLTWSRGGYEVSELENVYTKSNQRVDVIIASMNKYLLDIDNFKALGFCVSIKHAEFMANSFKKVNIPSIALHSKSSSKERDTAIQRLRSGEIKCIFTVDLFNEGVDIPEVDTILFLRPTESLTIFLQQLGRGLRLSENKEVLTVLDFIGHAHQNYDFSYKFRALMGRGKKNISKEIQEEFPNMPIGSHIKLEKVAQEYILQNIQASTNHKTKLKQMILNFKNNFSKELTLENFLDCYDLNINEFYSRHSFYQLLTELNVKSNYDVKDKKLLNNALRRFSTVDSKRLLSFSKKILTEKIVIEDLTEQEILLLGMFHYTVWGRVPEKSYKDNLKILKEDNPDIVKELLDIIAYNQKSIQVREIAYEEQEIPLDVYSSYTVDQVLVAFGKTVEDYKYPFREGVLYIEDYHTDIFFITINKNEEDYLPTTMYNDYAINQKLFNWETQSQTSDTSPTGKRYIEDRSEEHKILLFVRENKTEYGKAAPYRFLGNASYHSHSGNKPIEIIWEMDHPIPERIIRESNLKIVD